MADQGSILRSTRCAFRGVLGAGSGPFLSAGVSSDGWGDDRPPGDHGARFCSAAGAGEECGGEADGG
ncbi:hypothetical protein GCM10010517_55580 [Streptosporangium fragile]|uniref:Uncharacterized protein n=1 Tax=Streptosporangium fragile TaxID=46186 RepID=A0ABN3W390_9ACTN